MPEFRVADSTEAPLLTDLAIRSKASWGYSPDFMRIFARELVINAIDCRQGLVRLVEDDESILGFYKLTNTAPTGELDFLFVEPSYLGQGIGSGLYGEALSHAGELGITELEIVAEPNTIGFYARMGAELINYAQSAYIPGRLLPVLRARTGEYTSEPI